MPVWVRCRNLTVTGLFTYGEGNRLRCDAFTFFLFFAHSQCGAIEPGKITNIPSDPVKPRKPVKSRGSHSSRFRLRILENMDFKVLASTYQT